MELCVCVCEERAKRKKKTERVLIGRESSVCGAELRFCSLRVILTDSLKLSLPPASIAQGTSPKIPISTALTNKMYKKKKKKQQVTS